VILTPAIAKQSKLFDFGFRVVIDQIEVSVE